LYKDIKKRREAQEKNGLEKTANESGMPADILYI